MRGWYRQEDIGFAITVTILQPQRDHVEGRDHEQAGLEATAAHLFERLGTANCFFGSLDKGPLVEIAELIILPGRDRGDGGDRQKLLLVGGRLPD